MIMSKTPRTLVGIAHDKTLNDHPMPIQAWHKSLRSIVGDGEPIVARRDVGRVNAEAEPAVVIGRPGEGLTATNAFDYVAGFAIANDITPARSARRAQRSGREDRPGQGRHRVRPALENPVI